MAPNGIMSSYPDFKISGRYDGSYPASRWLTRVRYDFKLAGRVIPAPRDYIAAIDMLAEGKAATFIDSSHRALCDKPDPSPSDVEKLESALKFEFPPILVDVIETPVQDQIRELSQLQEEGLQAYTQRVAILLHKSGGKDKSRESSGTDLSSLEKFALAQVIESYVKGLYDEELRAAVIAKLGECTSLWRAGEVILEAKRSREAMERLGLGGEKERLQKLEQLREVMDLPPPPQGAPEHRFQAPQEANSSQRKAHNREGYGIRLESKGATLGFSGYHA